MLQRLRNLWALSAYEPKGLKEFEPKEFRHVPVTVLLDSSTDKAKKMKAVFIPRIKRDPVQELTQENEN